ncbi:hypothetical protein DAERI_100069 [Deinococcus aerius]|uniref:Uncharacterized protein n=1 Tax=Deinococcus aerius TaxID=200253 RepID=A0A2I9D7G8_9DEIO|nr:hypothetical protein DAERI_100069 [Deinococcus aerius]
MYKNQSTKGVIKSMAFLLVVTSFSPIKVSAIKSIDTNNPSFPIEREPTPGIEKGRTSAKSNE